MNLIAVIGLSLVFATSDRPVENVQQNSQGAANITLEMLAREGYEVKGIQSATTRNAGFVVILQRGPEIRTCLMRIERTSDGRPSRQSVCF